MKTPSFVRGAYTLIELLVVVAVVCLLVVGGFSVAAQLFWLIGEILWVIVQLLPLIFVIVVAMLAWTFIQKTFGGPKAP